MRDKKMLERYRSILEGREKAKYLLCQNQDEGIRSAREIMENCRFCERRCGVNRLRGERGYCRVLESRIASEFIHWGEEPELTPSYTIFFSGCTFACIYCQNWDISQYPGRGVHIRPATLANMISKAGAKNVNWVGGDPTPNIYYILRVLEHSRRNIPQIWNSNMYLTVESMRLLEEAIDIYLTDFKYGNDRCAERLSHVKNYMEVVERNHIIAENQGEVIIRHLILPDHLECCTKPILQWISENLRNARVNIMDQYHPDYRAGGYDELRRGLSPREFHEAVEFGRKLGLDIME
jgi:putative pyruvate formate lyase activating enzyme